MKILVVHQNFPGQYLHLVRQLGAAPGNEVVFITQRKDGQIPGVRKIVYQPKRTVTRGVHHYVAETEAAVLNAQEVARIAMALKQSGFVPDIMLGHNGWGEIWYLKDVFPNSPLIGYFEFFYRTYGADIDFEPGFKIALDTPPRVRTKNLGNLLALDTVDAGQCATYWQKSLYPKRYQSMLHVVHEGIDTQYIVPNLDARLRINNEGLELGTDDEVVTYVARNLEPYRGFPSFMRSLIDVLSRRPKVQVVVVGGDEVSYGARLPDNKTFRAEILKELGPSLDLSRIHFLGRVPYSTFLSVLQISTVHVYLSYPFVLSWSMLEAMSAGCLVIGSRSQMIEEVIRHGENGLLVDFFSPTEIADRIVSALEDPRAYSAIKRAARQTIIDQYDLKTICLPAYLRLLDIYLPKRPRSTVGKQSPDPDTSSLHVEVVSRAVASTQSDTQASTFVMAPNKGKVQTH